MFKRHLRKLRALLRSRKLFRNWLSAGVKYYLVKGGSLHDDYIEVVCRDGSKGLIPVRTYAVLAYEYYDGYLMKYDCRNGIATYVNNVQVPVEEIRVRSSVWLAIEEGWAYDMANRFWIKNGIKFRYMYRTIHEIFDLGVYDSLDIKDKVVIDVGAFVGDSAIYFALKGAKRVIAVEPHPGAFAEMLENIKLNNENIKLNNIGNIIIPVNAGLASKSGKVCLEKSFDNSDTLVMYHGLGDCINAVSAVTLGELISRFGVDPGNAVLKMDCEGCEYDVILNDYEHIRMLKELVFEYHPYIVNKPLDDLLNMLSRDFRCVKIKGDKNLGIVHCIRK
jgi:FkbM family methyltransferase